tara:strand:- start:4124 stop:4498 length:375 start_codon:yes stop_codon:yes gene_type:complete
MRKLLFEMIVRMVTGSSGKTERIMQIAYGESIIGIKDAGYDVCNKGHYYRVKDGNCQHCKTPVKTYSDLDFPEKDYFGFDFPEKVKTKKDELLENLSYLKSKPNKTKQDKESIYTLEVVLKNMK